MELILHIGMGKTGSSAIQKTLNENKDLLKSANCRYTGMWLQAEEAKGRPGYQDFFNSDAAAWADRSKKLLAYMQAANADDGVQSFISSNESFFHHGDSFKAFIEAMQEQCEVRVIAYARNPVNWLPSAFSQWGIRHKTMNGPIPSYPESTGKFIDQYEHLVDWYKLHEDITTVFYYDEFDDIVKHFFGFCGMNWDKEKELFYTRRDSAESMLRALFNNRFPTSVRPERFNTVLGKHVRGEVASIDEAYAKYLDFSQTKQIVGENQALFDRFKEVTGVDVLQSEGKVKKTEDIEDLRRRMIDFVVEIAISHSMTLKALNKRTTDLEAALEALKKD